MYRIIKVLNNNGILVYHNETGRELILMGNGIGFGKKPTQQIESVPGAKVYSLVTRRKQQSVLKVVNGIHPSFIEASGRIIEEAEKNVQKKTGRSPIRLPRISGCFFPRNMQLRCAAGISSKR